jgi:hypothetical protein
MFSFPFLLSSPSFVPAGGSSSRPCSVWFRSGSRGGSGYGSGGLVPPVV